MQKTLGIRRIFQGSSAKQTFYVRDNFIRKPALFTRLLVSL